jgi:hypothetical protein
MQESVPDLLARGSAFAVPCRSNIRSRIRNLTLNPKCWYEVHSAELWAFIHSLRALQPFVGPWPLLEFRNLFYTVFRIPWTSDQPVARPLPTHRTTQTQNKRTQASMLWVGLEPTTRAGEGSSCLRPRGHYNSTVVSNSYMKNTEQVSLAATLC